MRFLFVWSFVVIVINAKKSCFKTSLNCVSKNGAAIMNKGMSFHPFGAQEIHIRSQRKNYCAIEMEIIFDRTIWQESHRKCRKRVESICVVSVVSVLPFILMTLPLSRTVLHESIRKWKIKRS